jgi:hypothetical protein
MHDILHDHGDAAHPHDHRGSTDPTGETARIVSVLAYMIEHNTQHIKEIGEIAAKLRFAGFPAAADAVLTGVPDFMSGNEKLDDALKILTD